MICKNCGNQIADGAAFCGVCGVKITDTAASSQTAFASQSAADSTPVNEPVAPAYANEGAVNPPVSKKSKFPKKLAFIGIPVLAVVLAVVLCFNTLAGFFVKNFGSNAAYFAYVEGTSLSGYGDMATSFYGIGKNSLLNGVGAKGELSVEIGDTLKTMLSSYAAGMDLSWLNQIKIVIDSDYANNNSSGTFGLVLGNQTILNVEYIMDSATSTVYVRCKELNDKFISFKTPDSASAFVPTATTDVTQVLSVIEQFPDEEQFNALLKKYITIALKQITDDDVTKNSGEITANGVTQNCTVLKLNVTDKLLYNIAKAVLTEAENDKDIIAIIENIEKSVKEFSNIEGNAVEEYKKGIAEALESINNAVDNLDGSGNEYLTITDYVNGSHEIIGREFGAGEDKAVSILSAQSGSDTGYEITVANQISIKGKGKKSGNAFSGDFSLDVEGKEMLTISVENFSSDLKDGALNGTVVAKLGKGVSDLMDSTTYTTISLLNLSLRMEFNSSSDKSNASIALLSGENVFVKLSSTQERTDAKVAAIPSEGETVNYTEVDVSDLDFTKIMENLKDAGVPQNLLSLLQYAAMAG